MNHPPRGRKRRRPTPAQVAQALDLYRTAEKPKEEAKP